MSKTKIISIIAFALAIILLSFVVVNYTGIKFALRKFHLDIRDRLNEGQGTRMIIDYSCYYWEIALDFENVAVVRLVERIPHFSQDKRAEYVFEVVEWIKGGNEEGCISVYSPYDSNTFSYSYMEAQEKSFGRDRYKYEQGKTYIIPLREYEGGYRNMQVFDYYQPLDEEIYRPYSGKIVVWSCFWDMFVKVVYPDGVEKLSCEEFLNCIRSGYADPEAFKEEASKIQAELEKPSDENG